MTKNNSLSDVQWAEIQGLTRSNWTKLPKRFKERMIQELDFVKKIEGGRIFFKTPMPEEEVSAPLKKYLEKTVGSSDVIFQTSETLRAENEARQFECVIKNKFQNLSFGIDVAERDTDLLEYFISTQSFIRANEGKASVIIGPKGSGKSAILRAVQSKHGERNTIEITPEIFATSMLKQVLEDHQGLWEEDQAFVATWIFTILVEVFKRFSDNPRGVPSATLKKMRVFLHDNADYKDLDLFTRFIGYLRRIEGVKIGPYELTVKTRMLQDLYALAPLYEIVPGLRGAGGEIYILLDELDQGWDNTPHSNQFIASLLKAAIKIQSLGLNAHVITFIRSEIFDLIKDKLDQLDKLRSSIELIRWTDGELANLLLKRLAHSSSFIYTKTNHEIDIVNALFEGTFSGMKGFQYILSRTSLRPREVLQFITHAHRLAVESGYSSITQEILFKAEEDFSRWKIEHICSEYTHIYPMLKDLLWSFRSEGPAMSEPDVISVIDRYILQAETLPAWASISKNGLLQLLYDIEFIGVPRPRATPNRSGIVSQYEFAYERRSANVRFAQTFLIHPAFWSVLEITNE